MKKIENETIRGQTLTVDGNAFVNCTLEDCVLEYGGSQFMLVDTELKGCRYVFFGPARGTVHFLQGVGMLPPDSPEWREFEGSGKVH